MDTRDLLYAHGMLCDYAKRHVRMDMYFASRLCDVINNFQEELRPYLVEGACDFHVKHNELGHWVEPIGGWK